MGQSLPARPPDVTVVLDMVGGSYIACNVRSPGKDGRLVLIAFLRGQSAGPRFRAGYGAAPDDHRIDHAAALDCAERRRRGGTARQGLTGDGCRALLAGINATFPLAQTAEAHRVMESSQRIGKIMLSVG
jgi:NADPH2:quinone reductase